MSFSGRNDEVVYIMVSIKLHVGKDMEIGHYVCYVLEYSTRTWCDCDGYTITNYSGYP